MTVAVFLVAVASAAECSGRASFGAMNLQSPYCIQAEVLGEIWKFTVYERVSTQST